MRTAHPSYWDPSAQTVPAEVRLREEPDDDDEDEEEDKDDDADDEDDDSGNSDGYSE
jgi:hypothetical protein